MKKSKQQESSQLDLWSGKQDSPWEEFKVAREYVRSLGLESQQEWESYVEGGKLKGKKVPGNPESVYQNLGWTGWNDWLGIAVHKKIKEAPRETLFPGDPPGGLWSGREGSKWMNFHDARRIAREYGFEYEEEWDLFTRGKFPGREPLPDNIPEHPHRVYRHVGWTGWRDWLVPPEKQVEYSGFSMAREFVRSCRIPDQAAWRDFLEQHAGLIRDHHFVLPERPHLEYKDSGWKGWEDWLGTDIGFNDYKTTRKFVHSLKLKSEKEWSEYCAGHLPHKPKKPAKVYTYPDIAFRDEGWQDWKDWLGKQSTVKPGAPSQKTTEIMIDCRCKGRIPDCPDCDGKGYYTVQLD